MWPYLLGAAALLFFVTSKSKPNIVRVENGIQVFDDTTVTGAGRDSALMASMEETMPHYHLTDGPVIVTKGEFAGAAMYTLTYQAAKVTAEEYDVFKTKIKDALGEVVGANPDAKIFVAAKISDMLTLLDRSHPDTMTMYILAEAVARVACGPGSEYACIPAAAL